MGGSVDIVPFTTFFGTSDRLIILPFQQNLLQTILSVSNKFHSYPKEAAFFTQCTEEPANPEAEITSSCVLKPPCVFQMYGSVSEIKKRVNFSKCVISVVCT